MGRDARLVNSCINYQVSAAADGWMIFNVLILLFSSLFARLGDFRLIFRSLSVRLLCDPTVTVSK